MRSITRHEPPDQGWEDGETRLPGPRFWRHILVAEASRTARYHRPATVLFAELVGLGPLRGTWGQDIAEQAVATVAGALRSGCRESEHLARLDDGRFGLILTETDEIAAINFVDRIAERCSARLGALDGLRVIFAWASAGNARTLGEAAESAEDWLEQQRQGSSAFTAGRRGG